MQFLKSMKLFLAAFLLFGAFLVGVFFEIFTETLKSNHPSQTLEFSRSISATSTMMASTFNAIPTFNASKLLSEKLELQNEDKVVIGDLFAKVLERVSKEDFCSGGSYEVRPTYKYHEGVRSIAGQELDARLNCNITKDQIEAYSDLLNDLNTLVAENGYVTLNIPAIDAIFNTEEIKNNEDKLYKDILVKAQQYAQEYSQDLNLMCTVVALQFDGAIPMPKNMRLTYASAPVAADSMLSSAPKSTVPIVADKEFSTHASVSFVCNKK